MKLSIILENLIGTHKFRNDSWEQIVQKLKTHDIHRIDQGAFGDVFAHPSWDYVVKVFDTDSAYLEFVNFVQQFPNKHYPKIIKSTKPIHQFHLRNKNRSDIHKYFFIVKIERLYDLSSENVDMVTELGDELKRVYKRHFNKQEYFISSVKKLAEKYPRQDLATLAVATYKAMSHLKSHTVSPIADLHKDNFMQRKDGTIVLIDPSTCLDDAEPYFREPLEDETVNNIR